MARRPRFQFSIAAILAVTTVMAVGVAILAAIDVPLSHPWMQGLFVAYLIFLSAWAFVCGPVLFRSMSDFRERKKTIANTWATIAEETRLKKLANSDSKESLSKGPTPLDG